jgi:hypothetical protein
MQATRRSQDAALEAPLGASLGQGVTTGPHLTLVTTEGVVLV